MSPFLVLVTAPGREEAHGIAHAVVEERLAACCNITERVESIYRWEGKVEEAVEWMMIIKTTADRLPALTERIVELHPYDTPEVLAIPIAGGDERYLAWLATSVA